MTNLKSQNFINNNSIFFWPGLITIFIPSIPLIAMQFSDEVNWQLFDFIVMGTLLYGMGSLFILAARRFSSHKVIIGILIAITFIYIWAELAVGIFTNLGS